jgi:hypothetical protein
MPHYKPFDLFLFIKLFTLLLNTYQYVKLKNIISMRVALKYAQDARLPNQKKISAVTSAEDKAKNPLQVSPRFSE